MSKRLTTVQDRFYVYGYVESFQWELVTTRYKLDDAIAAAVSSLVDDGYVQAEVYDSMAQPGQPERWAVDAKGNTTITSYAAKDDSEVDND